MLYVVTHGYRKNNKKGTKKETSKFLIYSLIQILYQNIALQQTTSIKKTCLCRHFSKSMICEKLELKSKYQLLEIIYHIRESIEISKIVTNHINESHFEYNSIEGSHSHRCSAVFLCDMI